MSTVFYLAEAYSQSTNKVRRYGSHETLDAACIALSDRYGHLSLKWRREGRMTLTTIVSDNEVWDLVVTPDVAPPEPVDTPDESHEDAWVAIVATALLALFVLVMISAIAAHLGYISFGVCN